MARSTDLDELIDRLSDDRVLLGALRSGADPAPPDRWADSVDLGVWLTDQIRDLGSCPASASAIPARDLDRFDCDPAAFEHGRATTTVRRLVRFESARARGHLACGPNLIGDEPDLRGKLRMARRIATAEATLDRVEAVDHDPLSRSTRPRPWRIATRSVKLLVAARRGRDRA